ncbi:head completion/stabilization protein [Lysobacter sp. K5869]|uniref:head completion/stabilization protein n=1 Tax=Lysobacter sp. K5869 TaxID=2820808 RepID=UPI001C06253A|nr:head completion/stabilization protein [Lysobacter sp. K5869]QWP76094.1 head completion/stabilization protein [Lysobacter sp. K5869]
MSAFIAAAPAKTAPDADTLQNDGWFPNLSLSSLRLAGRIDGTVPADRLRELAMAAALAVNARLREFRAGHEGAGYASLAAVPASRIGGESRLLVLYRRAVACLLKADVIERYRDFDSTDSGQRRADDQDPAADTWRRNATWAVSDITGQTRTVVELI